MPLPSVSTPFDYLVNQIKIDLNNAVKLCEEIRRSRHVGKEHKHTQLDLLQESLERGPRFISGIKQDYESVPGADTDGGDDIARTDFTGYVRQVEEINVHLEAVAYPPTHNHGYHHHHHHTLYFPIWDPACHKEKEDPHFHDLRLKWENIRDGIPQTFAEMRVRLEKKEEDKKKKKDDEKKIQDDLDEARKKLEEVEKENMEKLKKEEKHNEQQREKHEELEEKRNVAVEKLVKTTLETDPIENMDKLAGVIGHIQRAITPRTSHEAIHLNVNSSALGSGVGSGTGGGGGGGGGGSRNPPVILCDHRHDHAHHHTHHPPRSISPCYSTASSSPRSSAHGLPLRITNNNIIQSADSDIEEIISDEEGRTIITNEHAPHVVRYINHHQRGHGQRSRSGNRLLEPETRHGEPGYFVARSVLADLVRR